MKMTDLIAYEDDYRLLPRFRGRPRLGQARPLAMRGGKVQRATEQPDAGTKATSGQEEG